MNPWHLQVPASGRHYRGDHIRHNRPPLTPRRIAMTDLAPQTPIETLLKAAMDGAVPIRAFMEAFVASEVVLLTGSLDTRYIWLLDNRTRDGRPGVEVLQVFHDRASDRRLLVNRGWLPWPDRRIPPKFDTPDRPLKLAAWVYAPSGEPFILSKRMAEGWPRLINHVDVEEIWQLLDRDGVSYELRLEPGPAAYRADWPVTFMKPQQHVGYAVQWFALAAALLALFIYFGVHQARGSKQ